MKNFLAWLGTLIKIKLFLAICGLALLPAMSALANPDSCTTVTVKSLTIEQGERLAVPGMVYLMTSDCATIIDLEHTNDAGIVVFKVPPEYVGQTVWVEIVPDDVYAFTDLGATGRFQGWRKIVKLIECEDHRRGINWVRIVREEEEELTSW